MQSCDCIDLLVLVLCGVSDRSQALVTVRMIWMQVTSRMHNAFSALAESDGPAEVQTVTVAVNFMASSGQHTCMHA